MTDPYEVLNIPNTATDDEVKKAYRSLARKYHPDNYHDNPLADLAQEKMKEINAAYDAIQRERSGHGRAAPNYGGGQAYQAYGGGQQQNTSEEAQILYQVRWAVMMGGSLEQAIRLLQRIPESGRGGEWNFLMGQVCYRRGWVDETLRYYQIACAKDPGNAEYRNALNHLTQNRAAYRPDGYGMSSTCSGGELCGKLACTYLMCNLGGCFYCC